MDWEQEKVIFRTQLKLAIANGFDCHVCDSKRFTITALRLVICEECAVVYHLDVLTDIYNK